jgi:flagellar basal-body rod modification protein FlgD
MSVIPAILNSSATSSDTNSRVPMQTLGEDDFLKLLVTQMTSQDPLNPQKDTDFIAQMAQFSALEQSKTMEGDLSAMKSQQDFTQAATLLGRTVQVQTGATTTDSGTVSAVQLASGTPQLLVNSRLYDLSQVLSVTPATTTP